ncbi:MAG: hypothetical protein ACFFE4_14155 [Candidatus Thorarchaeota archaeon]
MATNLALDDIEQGWLLLNEGKEDEALRLIRILEKNENLTPEEKLKSQILKGTLLFFLVKIEESLNISRKVYNEYIHHGNLRQVLSGQPGFRAKRFPIFRRFY